MHKKGSKKNIGGRCTRIFVDIDFELPFVNLIPNTTAAGACTGLGWAPNKLANVIGISRLTLPV